MIGLVVLSLTAASCGGGAPESGETSVTVDSTTAATVSEETETDVQPDEELIELQVGYIAVSSAAPLFVAEQSGIFESHGLAVTLVPLEPPSMIPSAVAGDIHFGFLNAPAVLIARQNNLPVKAVASISAIGDDPADYFIQLLVPEDSDIEEPQDLVGRTVAVAGLFQLPHLGLIAGLQHHNVDPDSVEYLEMPFPNMPEGLASGDVDAVLAAEPFATLVEDAGGRIIMSGSEGQPTNIAQSVMLAEESFIAENSDVVDRFVAAIDEVMANLEADQSPVREVIPTYTQISPELADRIRLGGHSPGFEAAGWEVWVDILSQADLVDDSLVVEDAFYTP